ncbi:hypothetical protein CSOJ01_00808 [Colletotrichum sojae]|uniref:Uncharacterized protein n=1 Tax=Colletotrichum sojae TaxID=2175907 RepID=A0A8H6JWQ2_9PEZI|nr:hypothetical protein CSOJ01_00808 [Colletotrichum sojae]
MSQGARSVAGKIKKDQGIDSFGGAIGAPAVPRNGRGSSRKDDLQVRRSADSLRARAFDGARVMIAPALVLRVPLGKGNKQAAGAEKGLPFDIMQRTYSGPNWADGDLGKVGESSGFEACRGSSTAVQMNWRRDHNVFCDVDRLGPSQVTGRRSKHGGNKCAVAFCYLFELLRRGQVLPSSQVETNIESAVEVDAEIGRKPSRSERSADQVNPAECT